MISLDKFIRWVCIGYALLVLYTSGIRPFLPIVNNSLFFGLGLFLAFTFHRFRKTSAKRIPVSDLIIMALILASTTYTVVSAERLLFFAADATVSDRVVGIFYLIILLEATRRVTGWILPVLILILMPFAYFGPYMPSAVMHCGFGFQEQIDQLYMGTMGYWGPLSGTVATWVAPFIVLGALLLATGGGETFINLGKLVGGRVIGGGAQTAVLSSALFGTISGSALANTATTGSFTIPLMKGLGYRPEFAGGAEAAASTGGQVIPPVMGSGAFLMAEMLGLPYISICIAAALPALLYYLGCASGVHFEALKRGYRALPRDEVPRASDVLTVRKLLPILSAIFVLFWFLFSGYSPSTAAFRAIVVLAIAQLAVQRSGAGLKDMLKKIVQGLELGGRGLITICVLVLAAQVFVSMVGLTALGLNLGTVILSISESRFFVLLLTMVISIIMGMAMPTVAAYVVAAAVAGPALIMMGMPPLSVHLFIFFGAALSNITPPVCGAAYVAATIADAPWLKIAIVACRLGYAGFLVPFLFMYFPSLLLKGEPLVALVTFVSAILGVICIGRVLTYYFPKRMGIAYLVAWTLGGACLVAPRPLWLSGIGLAVIVAAFVAQRHEEHKFSIVRQATQP